VFTFFFQVGEEEEERKNKRERVSGVLSVGGFSDYDDFYLRLG
jgi:hypothetical protein